MARAKVREMFEPQEVLDPNKQYTYKDIVDTARDAIDKWVKRHLLDPEKFRQRIYRELDKNQESILMSILGFSNKWGRWEVDTKDHSLVSQHISNKMNTHITEWLDKQVGKLPAIPQTIIDSVHKTYFEYAERKLRTKVMELAEKHADQMADQILNQISSVDKSELKKGLNAIGFLLALPGNNDKAPG